VQDEDTLDTWFSSGLWTFSTLGWPEQTDDLRTYHPTTVINPGYEILQLWVSRMIMMSGCLLGDIPFHIAYFHGIVRDKDGRKFSKSLNNGIDPLEVIKANGTDALRMSLIVGVGPGSDLKFDMNKVKAYRHFANKLWNITRFVLSHEDTGELKHELVDEFNTVAQEVTAEIDAFRLHTAAEKIYQYVWTRFADEILEASKKEPGYDATLHHILRGSLKLLHPFMPFVTEALWEILPTTGAGDATLLMVSPWPTK
jgi:valyl-tRNA synthetase